MREEAPVYYNSEHDFYALSRHEDVAAAYKDFATYSSAYGLDLATVRSEEPFAAKMIILMDPPEHRQMRSLVNKVFTPRAIEAMRPMVTETIDRYLGQGRPDALRRRAGLLGVLPVEVITQMLGVPEEYRQQVREWVDNSLHRNPVRSTCPKKGMQAIGEAMGAVLQAHSGASREPCDDMFSRLIAAEIEREDGGMESLDDFEIAGFATLLGGAGAETVTKLVGNAAVTFARYPRAVAEAARRPQQDSRRGRGTAALRAAGAVQRATVDARGRTARSDHPRGQARVPAAGFGEPRSRGVHRRRHVRHRPRPHRGAEPRLRLRRAQLSRRGAGPDGERDRAGAGCSTSCRATR